jgi:hypothetical protein
MRSKGTLINFVNDGDLSRQDMARIIASGKVPVGQERTLLIERTQLEKWGVLRGQ